MQPPDETGERLSMEVIAGQAPADDQTDVARFLFEHMQGQINFADTKAQLTLAADALLAASVSPLVRGAALNLLDPASPVLIRVAGAASLLMFAALLLSIYFSLVVARPTLNVRESQFSLFYFGHIARSSEAEFIARFTRSSPDELRTAILAQVYAKAKIATRKFAASRVSLNFLFAALALWAVAQGLLAFVR